MVAERLTGLDKLAGKRAVRPFARIYTLLAVLLGFVLFRADSVSAAFAYIGKMFSFVGGTADVALYFTPWTIVVFIAAILFSTPIVPFVRDRMARTEKGASAASAVGYAVVIPLFALSIGMLVSSSFNPFIYYIF